MAIFLSSESFRYLIILRNWSVLLKNIMDQEKVYTTIPFDRPCSNIRQNLTQIIMNYNQIHYIMNYLGQVSNDQVTFADTLAIVVDIRSTEIPEILEYLNRHYHALK